MNIDLNIAGVVEKNTVDIENEVEYCSKRRKKL